MSILYYAAKNASNFYTLWKTDGTLAGTQNILTPTQNFGSTSPYGLITLGDEVIFAAQDPTGQTGVWVSGGASATTFELVASRQGSSPLNPESLTKVGDHVIFLGVDANGKNAVFSTGGASGDPVVLLEYDTPAASIVSLGNFALVLDRTYPLSSSEIWVTDGTAADTHVLVAQASAGADDFYSSFHLAKVGTEALMEIKDASGSVGVVAAAGATGGLVNVVSGKQGLFDLAPSAFTVAGDDAFFTGAGSDGQEGLWVVKGTAATEIAELSAFGLTAVGDDLVFEVADSSGDDSLYWSDGTHAGTREVYPGLFGTSGGASIFFAFGARALFTVAAGGGGLWITNGQSSGTIQLASSAQGLGAIAPTFVQAGSHVFFLANDASGFMGVWATDGSVAGTVEVLSGRQGGVTVTPQNLTVFGDKLAFTGEDSSGRTGVFVSDGTVAGTVEVLALPLGQYSIVGVAGTDLVIGGYNAKNVYSEWSVDGVPADSAQIGTAQSSSVALAATSVPTHASEDFNGDGKSDALFENGAQQLSTWQLASTGLVGGGALSAMGVEESLVGAGDTVGQGYASLIFFNAQTGAIALWRMFGAEIAGGGVVGTPYSTWRVFGVGDLNGDGASDVILRDDAGQIGVWELSGSALIGGGAIGNPGPNWTLVGAGDFNGDGKTDLLFKNQSGGYAAWLMNGSQVVGGGNVLVTHAYDVILEGTGDFNGDGTSDLLFYNVDTHVYQIDFLRNDAFTSLAEIANAPTTYVLKGEGDYNGDGKTDLLFENLANGHYIAWFFNGATVAGTRDYGAAGPTWSLLTQAPVAAPEMSPVAFFKDSSGGERPWSLAGGQSSLGSSLGAVGGGQTFLGVGDAFGDHNPDLLFQSASSTLTLWRTAGSHGLSQTNLGSDAGMTFVGFGDFNDDGRADILFQAANGDDVIWSLNGASVLSQTTLASPGYGFNAVAAGDFTGDGTSDILFKNASGAMYIEAIGADQAIPGGGALASPGAGWTFKGTGDFNGDGKADILFESASGLYALWDMSGNTIIGGGDIGTPPSTYQFKGIADLNGDHLDSILFYDTATSGYVAWNLNSTSLVGQTRYGSPGAGMTFQSVA